MGKIANLYIDDFFPWGVWQKINLTGDREMSFGEIKTYADLVDKLAQSQGVQTRVNFGRNEINHFLNMYSEYLTYDDNSIMLNDNVSYEDSLEIFHMGATPLFIVELLINQDIAQTMFADALQEKQNPPQNDLEL